MPPFQRLGASATTAPVIAQSRGQHVKPDTTRTPLIPTPLNFDDVDDLLALCHTAERHDAGIELTSRTDITDLFSSVAIGLGTRVVGVFFRDTLVGYCSYFGADRFCGTVHPQFRRMGVGAELLAWVRRAGRTAGKPLIGTNVISGSAGERFLRRAGFAPRYRVWRMNKPLVPRRYSAPSSDVTITTAPIEAYEVVWNVLEDGFLEWSDRGRIAASTWAASAQRGDTNFHPCDLRVAIDRNHDIVGASLVALQDGVGVLDRVAVSPSARSKGVGSALVRDALAMLVIRGADRLELWVDERSGARTLYDRLGFAVMAELIHLADRP